MKKCIVRNAALVIGLLLVTVPATSYARYTFGRLKSVAGGTLARDELQGCSPRVPDNLKEDIVYTYPGQPPQESYVWGQDAQDSVAYMGLPIEVDDDGSDCSQYSGNVYLHFKYPDGSDFWVTANPGHDFHQSFFVWDDRIHGSLANGVVEIWKKMGCPGHNEWHSVIGTGGYPGWGWVANVTYFKSG